MKKVLVACGNGIATSTVVATKIKEKCEDYGIHVSIAQCKLMEIDSKAADYDLIVTTGKFVGDNLEAPVIGAMPLLTGIGEEEILEKIISYLK